MNGLLGGRVWLEEVSLWRVYLVWGAIFLSSSLLSCLCLCLSSSLPLSLLSCFPYPASPSLCVSLPPGCPKRNNFSLHCLLAVMFHLTKAHYNGSSRSWTETSGTMSQKSIFPPSHVSQIPCSYRDMANTPLLWTLPTPRVSWRKVSKSVKNSSISHSRKCCHSITKSAGRLQEAGEDQGQIEAKTKTVNLQSPTTSLA